MKRCILSVLGLALLLEPETKLETQAAGSDFRLESGNLPLAIRLQADPSHREIRSIRIAGKVPSEKDGAGEVWFDTRPAELNPFGDVLRRAGPEPPSIRVQLRYEATGTNVSSIALAPNEQSRVSEGFRLYTLVFPGGALSNCFQLVLGKTNLGPHRLLVRTGAESNGQSRPEALTHILPLEGVPGITSVLPDGPLRGEIQLSGFYTALDGRIHRLELRGTPGGAGTFAFDPNYITFDPFGEPTSFTAMGYRHHEITLKPSGVADPLNHGRQLYWIISKDPKNTNRIALVLGRTEDGPHRILLYQGDEVAFLVPADLADRRGQEVRISELGVLPTGEQQAITDLRSAVGYRFRWQIDHGHIETLDLTIHPGRVPPAGVLARLPHLRSVQINGEVPAAGLPDLRGLPHLRSLMFGNAELQPDAMAMLKDLNQLETLTFYNCRGIRDDGVKHLAGLSGLKMLSFYSERLLRRPPDTKPCITDTGLACLKNLSGLKNLDLFGHDLSDRSVPVLTGKTELQELALSGKGFTDTGLAGLSVLPKLRSLRLFETSVTTNGVAALKQHRSSVQVEAWNRDGHD